MGVVQNAPNHQNRVAAINCSSNDVGLSCSF